MWKNVWPLLLLGAAGYVYYTGWRPGGIPNTIPVSNETSSQAGGPAVVREYQQMPAAIQDSGAAHGSGSSAQMGKSAMNAARNAGN